MMKDELGDVYDLVGRMNRRNAVKGGCTEVFRMHAVVKNPYKQMIKYLDVNSLYPYVMANKEFPVGHPVVRRGIILVFAC